MPRAELQPIYFPEAREIQSECGLATNYITREGIKAGLQVTKITLQEGIDLQHRAQGSAGMVISNGTEFDKVKNLGWVRDAFDQGRNLPHLSDPFIGMIHTRYPTSGGSNHVENIQPFGLDGIWFGHHGNLTNIEEIKEKHGPFSIGGDFPDSDSWIAFNTIVRANGSSLGDKLINAQRDFEGGWAFILTDGKAIVASRDPYGIRPLMLGYIGPEDNPWGYAIAVETSAFEKIKGYRGYRDILPGETVQIDERGETILERKPKGRKHCAFEHVYMQWPSSFFEGKEVLAARENMGRILWREAPIEVKDGEQVLVVPVPDTARPAARAYVEEAQKTLGSSIRLEEALLKNRYVGRLYIESSDKRVDTQNKYTLIKRMIKGRKIVVIDDSIVHGITSQAIIGMFLDAGAAEVHLRIHSPSIVEHCNYGVDQSGPLIAKDKKIEEIAMFLGVNSLGYLSREGLAEATGIDIGDLCMSCFGGDGPPIAKSTIPLNEA